MKLFLSSLLISVGGFLANTSAAAPATAVNDVAVDGEAETPNKNGIRTATMPLLLLLMDTRSQISPRS
jgi:hypothetical protein